MRRLLLLGILGTPTAAFAHHPVSDFGIALVKPTPILETTLEVADLEQGRFRGRYQELSLYFEYPVISWLSLAARLPALRVESAGAPARIGMGDPEVVGKASIDVAPHGVLTVAGGLGLGLPLGIGEGLSSGRFEVTPFLLASSSPLESLSFVAMLRGRIVPGEAQAVESTGSALTGAHVRFVPPPPPASQKETRDELPPAMMVPHADREIGGRLAIAYLVAPAYALVSVDLDVPIASDAPIASSARLEVGVRLWEHLRIAARGELPLAGDRFERKGGVGVAWIF